MGRFRTHITDHHYVFRVDGESGFIMYAGLDDQTYAGLTNVDVGSLAIYNGRWTVWELSDAVNEYGFRVFKLPAAYKAGTDITIDIDWSTSATSGNLYWNVGLGYGSGTTWSSEALTDYFGWTTTAVAGTSYEKETTSFTFDGSSFSPGDTMSALIVRQGSSVTDTVNAAVYLHSVSLRFKIDKYGNQL